MIGPALPGANSGEGAAALLGALAILGAAIAQGLGMMVAAQFAAGAAWGCILMSAFTVAFALGRCRLWLRDMIKPHNCGATI